MRASLEIHAGTAGTLRIGEKHEKYGDDYEWSCTVAFCDGVATLKGVDRPLTPSMIRAGRECLRSHGFAKIEFERLVDGKRRRLVEVKI